MNTTGTIFGVDGGEWSRVDLDTRFNHIERGYQKSRIVKKLESNFITRLALNILRCICCCSALDDYDSFGARNRRFLNRFNPNRDTNPDIYERYMLIVEQHNANYPRYKIQPYERRNPMNNLSSAHFTVYPENNPQVFTTNTRTSRHDNHVPEVRERSFSSRRSASERDRDHVPAVRRTDSSSASHVSSVATSRLPQNPSGGRRPEYERRPSAPSGDFSGGRQPTTSRQAQQQQQGGRVSVETRPEGMPRHPNAGNGRPGNK